MIDITLLGTSALAPLPERALTSVFLSCGGHSILFDCGEGTQTAARKAGVSLMKTDIIALSHYHGDHIFGLPGLLQTMLSMNRTEPLYVTGPEGLREVLSDLLRLAGMLSYPVIPLFIPDNGLCLRGFIPGFRFDAALSAFPTEHRVPSRGYCFTLFRPGKFMPEKAKALGVPLKLWNQLQKGEKAEFDGVTVLPEQVLGEPRKGLKFVFSGDTAYCGSLIDASRGADLAVYDATYGENGQAELATEHGHMNFAQAADAAKKAGVKQLWLSHYSQMIQEPSDYLQNAAEIFENAVCGHDGLSAELKFEE